MPFHYAFISCLQLALRHKTYNVARQNGPLITASAATPVNIELNLYCQPRAIFTQRNVCRYSKGETHDQIPGIA